jgi:hypothetical protein
MLQQIQSQESHSVYAGRGRSVCDVPPFSAAPCRLQIDPVPGGSNRVYAGRGGLCDVYHPFSCNRSTQEVKDPDVGASVAYPGYSQPRRQSPPQYRTAPSPSSLRSTLHTLMNQVLIAAPGKAAAELRSPTPSSPGNPISAGCILVPAHPPVCVEGKSRQPPGGIVR